MNEPRSANLVNQAIIATWQQDLAQYIHQLDPHHPVISGVEGFIKPIYDDPSGPNFIAGNNSPELDIASGHLYRKYLPDPDNIEGLSKIITVWSKQARQLNKPLIIGEVGFSSAELPDRENWFKQALASAQQNEISGILLWNYAYHVDTPYNISPVVPADQALLKSIRPLIPANPFPAN
jgi:endo-1,4-beta-mannosidase